ncbi:hypothetical protein Tco_1188891 [Tanacetum coccineum]
MDPYLDKEMGDVIVGEPFYKASYVEARRFDGIVTIRDGDNSVTYQMVRANSRFKHLTNEKCNKIPPLLKVSEQDKMNGITHSYQKLKGFYKGVSNLRSEFIRDAKVSAYDVSRTSLEKEIDNVGGVSIIWNPMCVCMVFVTFSGILVSVKIRKEVVADPSALVEALLSKKPKSLRRPTLTKTHTPASLAPSQKVTPSTTHSPKPMSPPSTI